MAAEGDAGAAAPVVKAPGAAKKAPAAAKKDATVVKEPVAKDSMAKGAPHAPAGVAPAVGKAVDDPAAVPKTRKVTSKSRTVV
jgi:hypothetical protein